MNWAWGQALPPSPKLILMALADASDDAGDCWPKVKTIAKKCCVSERTVQRAMKDFIASGLLEMTHRFNHDGRQVSNNYRLRLHSYPDSLSPSPPRAHTGVTRLSDSGSTQLCRGEGDVAMTCLEPPIEPKNESSKVRLHFHPQITKSESIRISEMLSTIPAARAQWLLDELGRAIDRNIIKTTREQWFTGVIRRSAGRAFDPERARRRNDFLSQEAYRDALIRKGLPNDDAVAIAAKTVRLGVTSE